MAESSMTMGEIIRWKERREDGWGNTVYTGIRTTVADKLVIITKLSHGLRVIPDKPQGEYQLQGSPKRLFVSDELLLAAEVAYLADFEFQRSLHLYEEAMGS